MKLKDIHIGAVIQQKFKESPLTVSQFAELIHCDRTTVYDIFKRKSVDIDRLVLISEALDYNFLWEVYLKNHLLGKDGLPVPAKAEVCLSEAQDSPVY